MQVDYFLTLTGRIERGMPARKKTWGKRRIKLKTNIHDEITKSVAIQKDSKVIELLSQATNRIASRLNSKCYFTP